MQEVDIFIETSFKGPARRDGIYMYVLRYVRSNGQEATIEFMNPIEKGSSQKAEARALLEALKRIRRPCQITVHVPTAYCKSAIEVWADGWKKKGFKNSKGEDVANRTEWEKILILLGEHEVTVVAGHHEFTVWMQSQIEKGMERCTRNSENSTTGKN